MTRIHPLFLLLALLFVGCSATQPAAQPEQNLEASALDLELRTAVERSLPLLQASMETWIREASCISCHHQGLGTMAVVMAAERGVPIDEALHLRQVERLLAAAPEGALHGNAGINATFGRSFQLIALAAAGTPRDWRTDALSRFLAGNAVRCDSGDGAKMWRSVSVRPPLEASHATGTAFAIRALDLYRADAHAAAADETILRARRYLESLEPENSEERAMRLLGLGWSGAAKHRIREAADDILRAQRPDGGWAQLATMESDAYATGQALVALQQMGDLAPSAPAFKRGIRFLLDEQLEDGSWLVKTRRRAPGLPYFETGFPHRMHQFISTAASAWASMALCCALDPAPSNAFRSSRPPRNQEEVPKGLEKVHLAAAFGTFEDLEIALNDGADPNARGAEGLTPLHLAIHDADMVRLLLARGAEVDARTEYGATPLILAAWYSSDDNSAAELLLSHGADVNARSTKDGMTPFLRAVRSSKISLARQLLSMGADLQATDSTGLTALHLAASGGDVSMAEFLLTRGAEVNPQWEGETPLHWASYDGRYEIVRCLLAHGADPNLTDGQGMTPLAWAAKVDHGNVRVLEALLDANADASIASESGRTPLEWAKYFDNKASVKKLEPQSAPR